MQTILGVFDNHDEAARALSTLETLGYNAQDISIVVKNTDPLTGAKGGSTNKSNSVSSATAGIVIGGLSGLLLGLAAVSIPGIGVVSVTDPLTTVFGISGMAGAIAASAVLGALGGAAIGALLSLNTATVPEYEEYVGEAVVLAVPATVGEHADRVRQIFQDFHAEQIRSINLANGMSQIAA